MRAYIAAKFSQRKQLREIALRLQPQIIVTSQWVYETEGDFHELAAQSLIEVAKRDIADIRSSDVVILDTTLPLSEGGGGGREFEAGYGAGIGLKVWRVGPARNPFHFNSYFSVQAHFDTWEELINVTKGK